VAIAADPHSVAQQLGAAVASLTFGAAAGADIAGWPRFSTLGCSTLQSDGQGPVSEVAAALVFGSAAATIDFPSDGVEAGFVVVRSPLPDASVDSWNIRTETVPVAELAERTSVFRGRATEVTLRTLENLIEVYCRWEGRGAAWWRLLP
jgi:hypothetical protein